MLCLGTRQEKYTSIFMYVKNICIIPPPRYFQCTLHRAALELFVLDRGMYSPQCKRTFICCFKLHDLLPAATADDHDTDH